jgi:hypothetical protein
MVREPTHPTIGDVIQMFGNFSDCNEGWAEVRPDDHSCPRLMLSSELTTFW